MDCRKIVQFSHCVAFNFLSKNGFLNLFYNFPSHTVTKSRKMFTQKNKMLLMKNAQFLPNQAYILPSEFIHWTDILTKFHNDWTKIVDFIFQGGLFLDLVTVCILTKNDFT